MSFWEQLKAVTWKNYTICKRHWFLTLIEIVAPIMAYLVEPLFLNRMYIPKTVLETYHHQQTVESLMQPFNKENVIMYAPNIKYVNDIMKNVTAALNLCKRNVIGFKNEEKLMNTLKTKLKIDRTLVTVIFKFSSNTEIEYRIVIYKFNSIWKSKYLHHAHFESRYYMFHNFLPLQIAVATTCLNGLINDSVIIVMEEFPRPEITFELPVWFASIYTAFTAIAFSILCINVLHRIVEDKSSGMKEVMKAMGMHPLLVWIEWYLHTFMISVISVLGCTILVKVTLWDNTTVAVYYSSSTVFFLFLFAYVLASVSMCFAISSFFCNPLLADTVGLVIWMLSYVYPSILMGKQVKKNIFFSLFPNAVLYSGFTIIQVFEERKIGIHWDNIYEYPTGKVNESTMSSVFNMLILDSVLYLLITLYLEKVYPGPYGISKPFYFPYKNFFHFFSAWHNNVHPEAYESLTNKIQQTAKLPVGISIKNVHKDFENIQAVNSVSFNIYKGQITGLLGHHGSGKSTIISILAGMVGACSGQVVILGHDIECDLYQIRRSLGVCLQEDMLFAELSVIEHLTFFGIIKGLSKKTAYKEACSLLRHFKLTHKKPLLVSQLSNAMKRKLSICIAIIGSPKVLLLDEPTVGLDEESSHMVWNMLLSLRHSRVIVFSTQSMEEADFLADQIAIFNQGNLVCYGTPSYLRTKYDAKYYLIITFDKAECSKTNQKETVKIVSNMISRAFLYCNTENKLTFSLPLDTQPVFPTLLETLENRKVQLQIIKMKLSVSTIEEIYLRISEILLKKERSFLVTDNEKINVFNISTEKLTGLQKTFSQFIILFKKRFWIEKRNWTMNLFEILFMVVITTLTLYTFDEHNSYTNDKTETKTYEHSRLYYSASNDTLRFSKMYGDLATQYTNDIRIVPNVHTAIINEGLENIEFYKKHLIVASEFNRSSNGSIVINALYSRNSIESAPMSFSLAVNTALKTIFNSDASIVCTGIPTETHSRTANVIINLSWFFIFAFGLFCYSGKYLFFPINEKITNFKHLQLSSGVHFSLYWIVCFIWDLIFFLALIGSIFVVILLYEERTYLTLYGTHEFTVLFFILIAYACSSISFSYAYSCKCTGTNNILTFMTMNMFLSFPLTHVFLCTSKHIVIKSVYYKLFQLHPQHGLTMSIYHFNKQLHYKYFSDVAETLSENKTNAIEWSPSYYYGPYGTLSNILIMFFSTFLYFAVLTAFETKVISKSWQKISSLWHNENFEKVNKHQEIEQVKNFLNISKQEVITTDMLISCSSNPIPDTFVSQNISKSRKHKYINKSIQFSVKKQECLGLLGTNGSGKTTFFQVVTGDCLPTSGDARINYENNLIYLSSNLKKYCSMLGYCPQAKGLMNYLTGQEMLYLFAKIRGVSGAIDNLVSLWINKLDLEVFSDMLCKNYSKGDKRKLSIGMALIGSPSVVFLDEPVAGVDPETYTNLSNVLNLALKQHNICIILGTQNPNICESISNKIGILKNGQMESCNNITYFQNKYGTGFTVKLKLNISKKQFLSDNIESSETLYDLITTVSTVYKRACHKKVINLMNDVQLMFNELCELKNRNNNLLHYHIQDQTKKWSEVFKEIADLQSRHSIIENYEISDSSLEEAFLSIIS